MANSINLYEVDATTASTKQFAVNFTLGYLSRDHVKVFVTGEVDGAGDQVFRTFTFINDSLVEVDGTLNEGDELVVRRDTPSDVLQHDYAAGSVLKELNLDQSHLQTIMLVHEVFDGRGIANVTEDLNFNGKSITNLADPVDAQDAATKFYVDNNLGTWREDWVTGTTYNTRDLIRDPVTGNMYIANDVHISTTSVADDIIFWTLFIDVSTVEAYKDTAVAAAATSTANAAATAADRVQTTADAVATAADRVQTGLDVISCAASEATAVVAAADALAYSTSQVPARNGAVDQDPASQGTSTRAGFEGRVGTGTSLVGGTNFLRLSKARTAATGWRLTSSLLGTTYLATDSTAVPASPIPAITADDVTYNYRLDSVASGTTNGGKAFTVHSNNGLGVAAITHEGDGTSSHEIPHNMSIQEGSKWILWSFNATDAASRIANSSELSENEYLILNDIDAVTSNPILHAKVTDTHIILGSGNNTNGDGDTMHHILFAAREGVLDIGSYTGTDVAGNYVDCGFPAGFVNTKNIGATGIWNVGDTARGIDNRLALDDVLVEGIGLSGLLQAPNGFSANGTPGTYVNDLNNRYLYMAIAESGTDTDASYANYTYPTTADTLSFEAGTKVAFANGFGDNGQVDTVCKIDAGVTKTLGAGFEDKTLWFYADKPVGSLITATNIGSTEYRPLEGITRNDADKWGEEAPLDPSLRTTAKHFGYQSETGIVSATSEFDSSRAVWVAFGDQGLGQFWNTSASAFDATTRLATDPRGYEEIVYHTTEPRVYDSIQLRSADVATTFAERFPADWEVLGSQDGTTTTSLLVVTGDSSSGQNLFEPSRDIPNATAWKYLHIRVSKLAAGSYGGCSLSKIVLNTKTPSDYYLVGEGKMYNDAGTPIERTYLAKAQTDGNGDIIAYENLPVAKAKMLDADVHGDLTVHGEIKNLPMPYDIIKIDGTQNPPLVLNGDKVNLVVKVGAGGYDVYVEGIDEVAQAVSVATVDNSSDSYATTTTSSGKSFRVNTKTNANAFVDRIFNLVVWKGVKPL